MSGAVAEPRTAEDVAFIGPLVGLEIEYFLVDAVTLAPRDAYDALAGLEGFGANLKTEVCVEQLEIASPPFASVSELAAWLVPTHRMVVARLADVGARLLPAALLDTAGLGVRADAGTRELAAAFGPALAANAPLVAADQVNLGADDATSAMWVLETVRQALPALMALGVASPLRHGRPNGVASNRLDVVEATAAANPSIVGFPDRLRTLVDHRAAVAALPILQRPGAYYKWVRPMPQRGVAAEVRCLDKQPTLSGTLAFAALCHGLARHATGMPAPVDEPWLRERFFRARTGGITAVSRPDTVLARAAAGLSPADLGFLAPLWTRAETGATPAASLARAAAESGLVGAYRAMAASFDADLEGLANTLCGS